MDPTLVALLVLRSVSTLFTLQGKPQVSTAINATLSAYQAGRNVDAHMQAIADALTSGADVPTWADIAKRANDETLAFLDQKPPTV